MESTLAGHTAVIMVSIGPLMLVVLVAAILLFAWRARRWASAPVRGPRPRHLVTRIVCGTLGAAILVAVAAGTWQEVQGRYATDAAGPFTVRVPTQAAPPPSPSKENIILADKARLLVHFVIGEASPAGLRPVYADEIELRWPEDRDRKVIRHRFATECGAGNWEAAIQLVLVDRDEKNRPQRLRPHGTLHLLLDGSTRNDTVMAVPFGRRMMSGFSDTGCIYLGNLSILHASTPPLSVVTGATRDLQAFAFVAVVADDDPLKAVPLDEFLQSRQPELAGLLRDSSRHSKNSRHDYSDNVPARGFALAGHIGASSLLLFVAAILFAQLFTRRNLAFAGVLAGVVLYVAALERIALGVHLSKLADPQAPISSRLTACREAPGTFFHRGTARRELQSVAADTKAPPALRAAASDSLSGLSQRAELEDE